MSIWSVANEPTITLSSGLLMIVVDVAFPVLVQMGGFWFTAGCIFMVVAAWEVVSDLPRPPRPVPPLD